MALIGVHLLSILRTEWTVAPHLVRRGTVLAGIFVIWLSSRLTNRLGGLQTPPFTIIQVVRFLRVSHILPMWREPLPSSATPNSHVFALQIFCGQYAVAESHEFGGLIRRETRHTLPHNPDEEMCPICLTISFMIWVGSVGLGNCEHHLCINCLADVAERQMRHCPLCRANLSSANVHVPRVDWPLPPEPSFVDLPHPAGAQNYFNYHENGVIRIPPLSPPAPRFLGASGKLERSSSAHSFSKSPYPFSEESPLYDNNELLPVGGPSALPSEEDEDLHLQQQLRRLRQQQQEEQVLDPTAASSDAPWRAPAPGN